jgi:hypothetical protein
MRAFQDYDIEWKGQTYVIPSDHLLPVIAAIEEVITLQDLLVNTYIRRMPAALISRAYAVILRAAGVKGADGKTPINEREVYVGMFDGEGMLEKTALAVQGLIGLMVPPETMPKEPAAPGKPQPASRRSRHSTKRRLARAG